MREIEYNINGKIAKVAVLGAEEGLPRNLDIIPIATHRANKFVTVSNGRNFHGLIAFDYFYETTNTFDGLPALWMADHPDQADDSVGRLHLVSILLETDEGIWDDHQDDEEHLSTLLMLFAHLRHFTSLYGDYEDATLEYISHPELEAAAFSVFDAAISNEDLFPELPNRGEKCPKCLSREVFIVHSKNGKREPKVYCRNCKHGFVSRLNDMS